MYMSGIILSIIPTWSIYYYNIYYNMWRLEHREARNLLKDAPQIICSDWVALEHERGMQQWEACCEEPYVLYVPLGVNTDPGDGEHLRN